MRPLSVGWIESHLRRHHTDSLLHHCRPVPFFTLGQWSWQTLYGDGTANKALDETTSADGAHLCYDPTTNSKGSHAFPYRSQIWAYDLNDLAAVRAGNRKPWEVVPYGVWPLTLPTTEPTMRLGGVGYDAERQTIYVSQLGADPDGYSSRPVMHALRVALPKPVQ